MQGLPFLESGRALFFYYERGKDDGPPFCGFLKVVEMKIKGQFLLLQFHIISCQ